MSANGRGQHRRPTVCNLCWRCGQHHLLGGSWWSRSQRQAHSSGALKIRTHKPGSSSSLSRRLLSISWMTSSAQRTFMSSAQLARTSAVSVSSIPRFRTAPFSYDRWPPGRNADCHAAFDQTKKSWVFDLPSEPVFGVGQSHAPSRACRSPWTLRSGARRSLRRRCFSVNRSGANVVVGRGGLGRSSESLPLSSSGAEVISWFRASRMVTTLRMRLSWMTIRHAMRSSAHAWAA